MNKDINERLKAIANRFDADEYTSPPIVRDVMREAADEIVSLRMALWRVQNLLQDADAALDIAIKETLEALGDE